MNKKNVMCSWTSQMNIHTPRLTFLTATAKKKKKLIMHFRTSEARAERFFPIDMVREIRGGVQY